MALFTSATPRQLSVGLALVRIMTGVVMFMHGYQKFFMMGLDGVTGFFTQIGVPLPAVAAPLVAGLELVGGIALIAGVLTRLVAAAFVVDMLGAIVFVHLANGFFVSDGGIEFVALLLVACIGFVIAGPGAYSIDESRASRSTVAGGDISVRRSTP